MLPRTGLVIHGFSGRVPSIHERRLAQLAARRGLFLGLSSFTDDDGGVHNTSVLGIEEFIGGTLYAYMLELPSRRSVWPEALDHYEKLLHAGVEREKEARARFKWWEHIS